MSSFLPPFSFPPADERERAALLEWVRDVPLVYGAWTHWKSLWKEAEAAFVQNRSEPELWAALLTRIDSAPLRGLPAQSVGLFAGSFISLALHPHEPLLYALRDDSYIVVLDVSTPVQPQSVGLFKVGASYYGKLQVVEEVLLYLGTEVSAFDLSDPRQLQLLDKSEIGYNASSVIVREANGRSYLLASSYNEQSSLQIPSRNSPRWMLLSKTTKSSGYSYHNMVQSDGALVVASSSQWSRGGYTYQFSVYDGSNSSNIVERATTKAQSSLFRVKGDLIFQINANSFSAIDLRDPSKPRPSGKLQLSRSNTSALYLQGDVAVVVCGNSYYRNQERALILIDISQPQSPRVIGELSSLAWFPTDLTQLGDITFVATSQGLRALDTASPSRVTEVGQSPSSRTFSYMKRRGRRLGRLLAESDEEASFELTARLIESTRGQESLDLGKQWIVTDALIGAGMAFQQLGHGRGPIVLGPKFHRRARLERAQSSWDAHRDTVATWTGEEFPWQIAVVARRALGQEKTPLSSKHLNSILRGNWPFALLEAARQAQTRLAELSPDALAGLLWCINRRRRAEILRALGAVEKKGALATGLANLLARQAPARGGFGRRDRDIALLLAARFDLSQRDFSARGAVRAIPALLSSNEAPLRELGLAFCQRLTPEVALETAKMAPQIEAGLLPRFYSALGESARGGRFEIEALAPAIRHADERVRRAVWAVIRASRTSDSNLSSLWTTLLRGANLHYQYGLPDGNNYQWQLSAALQTALDSDDALAVLGRAGAKTDELRHLRFQEWQPAAPAGLFAAWTLFADIEQVVAQVATAPAERWNGWKGAFVRALPFSPTRVGEFWQKVRERLEDDSFAQEAKDQLRARTFGDPAVATTFAGVVSSLAPALLVGVIAGITDETWAVWREGLLRVLQEDTTRRQAFWDAVRANGFDDVLRARLIDDAEFAATFGLLPSVLEFDDPTLEPLLMAWLEKNRDHLKQIRKAESM